MARFRCSVVLEPVPRSWFDENVGLGHDVLAEYLGGPDLPLSGGDHLKPGAFYSSADESLQVTVDAWHPKAETSCGFHLTDTDTEFLTIVRLRLNSASAPRTVAADWDARLMTRGVSWMTAFTGGLRADLERWWSGTARGGGQPAISVRVNHTLIRASFAATPSPEPDGRWRVTVHGTVRGRGLLTPFTALALLVYRAKLRRGVAETVDKIAEDWNREVPALIAARPDELRARIRNELARST
jgi:hypothetical protein